ncbi:MAG: hypothetical protein PF487_14175, partial [Bacteroidales bacterium]|nr:hypothetical protein [Bacteroidales bacterium]
LLTLAAKFHHLVNGKTSTFLWFIPLRKRRGSSIINANLLNFVITKKQKYEARISLKRINKYTS